MGLGVQTTLNYATAGNFTFDAALVEFVGSLARLKQLPIGTFLALYRLAGTVDPPNNAVGDGDAGGGDLTVQAVTGVVTVASGRLQLLGAATEKRIEYDAAANADSTNVGCLRIGIVTGYTGSPTTDQQFYGEGLSVVSAMRRFLLSHNTAGVLTCDIFDNAGATIVSLAMAGFSPTAGVEQEIEVNWDMVAGSSRLYVDGIEKDADANTGSRNAPTLMYIGALSAAFLPDFEVTFLNRFLAVQHTANYTPTGPDPLHSLADPTVEICAPSVTDGLKAFGPLVADQLGTGASGALDEVRFVLKVNTVYKWHNGGGWVTSDKSFAQSNTLAQVSANVATLDLTPSANLRVVALLHSDDGETTPTVTSIEFEFDFFQVAPTQPTKVVVFGNVFDAAGMPLEGETVEVDHDGFRHGSFQVDGAKLSALTDEDGKWELQVFETATLPLAPYDFRVGGVLLAGASVPDLPTVDFGDLTATE
jgi:hypothetical protein